MMVIVDYVNVLTKGKLAPLIKGNKFRQYTIVSLLGAIPGCLGSFLSITFYVRGLISFGAIVGTMIATSGDEAFIMLALFPKTALLLFALLFILGIGFAWLTDKLALILRITPCRECNLSTFHYENESCRCFSLNFWKKFPKLILPRIAILTSLVIILILVLTGIFQAGDNNWSIITFYAIVSIAIIIAISTPDHYLEEHIWDHIIKKHIGRVFLWIIVTLLFVHIGTEHWTLTEFIKTNQLGILFLSALIGIIPESGPHIIFITMFARGLIPFSILFTSSFVQDGHGLIPLLSYSPKDAVRVKLFNVIFGLIIGLILFRLNL